MPHGDIRVMPSWPLRFFAFAVLSVFLGATSPVSAQNLTSGQQSEAQRTWDGGLIFVPFRGGVAWGPLQDLMPWMLTELGGESFPTIIYMHGCSGIDGISRQVGNTYAAQGFVVIAPDSFARQNKPASCDPVTNESGMHRGVLAWRQAELDLAIRNARALAFVDGSRISAHGFSEGAITVATFEGVPINARIVEGWTCHAGWVEYVGINAPDNEPVLTLVGEVDPWFQQAWSRGDCGRYLNNSNGSRSIVYERAHRLGGLHYLFWDPVAQAEVFNFIEQHSN